MCSRETRWGPHAACARVNPHFGGSWRTDRSQHSGKAKIPAGKELYPKGRGIPVKPAGLGSAVQGGFHIPAHPQAPGAVRLQDLNQCLAIPAHSLLQNTFPLSALPEGPTPLPGTAGTHILSSQKVLVSVGYPEPFIPSSFWQAEMQIPCGMHGTQSGTLPNKGTALNPPNNRNSLPWALPELPAGARGCTSPSRRQGLDNRASSGLAAGWKSPGSQQDPIPGSQHRGLEHTHAGVTVTQHLK